MWTFPGLRRTSPKVAAVHMNGPYWKLLRPYKVQWNRAPWSITANVGFVTDFSSVPQIVRSIVPQRGDQDGPAVIHDYCYRYRAFNRSVSDALFLTLLKLEGVRRTRRWALYLGVRVGGWVSWNNYRKYEGNT